MKQAFHTGGAVRRQARRFFSYVPRGWRWLNDFFDRHPWVYWAIVSVIIVIAGLCRLWAAPLSAGPDIGQFWGFAKEFQQHGLDFYRYAGGTAEIFPVKGWGFVYPPIWLFILRLALAAAPHSLATSSLVDVSWRVALKTPIMASDLAIGGLLLWGIPGSKLKKLGFASAWLFHPTAWYNSAVFGQFDAVAAALLVASVILLVRGRDRLGFILAALAVMTKQDAALPVLLMVVVMSRRLPRRRFLADCAIALGIGVAISVPFLVTGNLVPYARSVLLPAQQPAYQEPLVFAFSGPGSLVTYLHDAFHLNTEWLLRFSAPLLIVAMLASAGLCYVKRIRVEQAALAGILIFVAIFYRINYQYLVVYIPLAILVLATTEGWMERGLAIALVAVPAVWLWLFDVSFWFRNEAPRDYSVSVVLGRVGLTNYPPEYAYVCLAGTLMVLCLAYVVVVLRRRSLQAADM